MKKNLLPIFLSALSAGPAFAQGSVYEFPKLENVLARPGLLKSQAKAPTVIDDKSEGISMYVGEIANPSKLRGFSKFKSLKAQNLTCLKQYVWNPEQPGDGGLGMLCGAYDGKNYYGIFGYSYTYGDYPYHLSKVDMQTGDTTAVYRYNTTEQSAWYNGDKMYAMAYDKAHDQLYGLALQYVQKEDGKYAYTVLYTIDRTTGKKEEVMKFDYLYYNFAFDADGNCYMLRPKGDATTTTGTEIVKFDSDFNQLSVNELKDEWGGSYLMYYFGAMSFDYTTGDLYWLPVGYYGATNLYKIDLNTNKFTQVSYFSSGGYSFTGLGIPYLTADSRKAPAQVSGLDAQPNVTDGSNDVLSWTNPTKAWDKTDLTGIKNVLIYRKKAGVATTDRTPTEELLSENNSELVATLDADGKLGEKMNWTDSKPNEGINTYYVLATNAAGEKGVLDSVRCYVGKDVPGAVSDIKLEKNGEGLRVSWKAPDKGANNGYIDESELKYTLVRKPDNKVVAENITATSFDDQDLGEQQVFSYVIQASNSKGKGTKAQSDGLMAGKALSLPVDLKFENQDEANRWTILNDGRMTWYYGGGYDDASKCLQAYAESSGTYDGTVLSAPVKLEKGKAYRFTTDFYVHYPEDLFNLKITVGTDQNSTANATVIRNLEDMSYSDYYHREKYEDMFTAPADGTYYYGLYVKTEDQYNLFKLYGLKVDEVLGNDMKAVSIDNIKEAVAGKDNDLTVKVRNNGGNDQSKYTVKVYCDDEGNAELVGETSNVPAVKSGEYAEVPLTIKPTKDGVYDFYAVVELDGDEDKSNDRTESLMLNVLPEGSAAWSNIVTESDAEAYDTHGVVVNYDTSEKSECIYTASQINAKENATIKRIAYVYSGNDLTDRTDPVDFKIYMAHTDKDVWTSSADWIDESNMTLVYEGQNTFEPGTDNLLSFDLQTPFDYDNTKNLVIAVAKDGNTPQFCALWKVFNKSGSETYPYRKIESGSSYLGFGVPVLYLALDYATGIENVVVGNDGLSYSNGAFTLGKNVQSATVYTVDGTLVAKLNAGNAQTALKSGLYIVRTVLADGKTESVKLNVK